MPKKEKFIPTHPEEFVVGRYYHCRKPHATKADTFSTDVAGELVDVGVFRKKPKTIKLSLWKEGKADQGHKTIDLKEFNVAEISREQAFELSRR